MDEPREVVQVKLRLRRPFLGAKTHLFQVPIDIRTGQLDALHCSPEGIRAWGCWLEENPDVDIKEVIRHGGQPDTD